MEYVNQMQELTELSVNGFASGCTHCIYNTFRTSHTRLLLTRNPIVSNFNLLGLVYNQLEDDIVRMRTTVSFTCRMSLSLERWSSLM